MMMGGGLQVYKTAARVRDPKALARIARWSVAMAEIIISGTEAITKPEFTFPSKPKEMHEKKKKKTNLLET